MPSSESVSAAPLSDAHRLNLDPEFQAIVKRKNSISAILSLLMLATYFAFMGLLAFAPDVLAAPFGRATSGIPFGIGVIVFAWILTGIYVRWANTKYDDMIAHLKTRVSHAGIVASQTSAAQAQAEENARAAADIQINNEETLS